MDVPLLFEGGLHRYAAKRITVACSPAVQLQRLMARDGSTKKDAYARIASQMPLGDKIALSEVVFLLPSIPMYHLQGWYIQDSCSCHSSQYSCRASGRVQLCAKQVALDGHC